MALLQVFLLSLLSTAASDAETKIVRREKHSDINRHVGDDLIIHKEASAPALEISNKDELMINTCNDDFPLGVEKRSLCAEASFDYLIINREICIEAAREAGVTTIHNKFEVQAEGGWRQKHPKGCFKIPCGAADAIPGHVAAAAAAAGEAATNSQVGGGNYCYFYNPIGYNPTETNATTGEDLLSGVPVCYRPKIVKGSVQSDKTTLCHNGFAFINTENSCSEAATCLGRCHGQLFIIDEEVNSKFNNYPEGCFIEDNTGCVYFNQRPNNWVDDPTDPVGTPLCNVTSQTLASSWPTAGPTTS